MPVFSIVALVALAMSVLALVWEWLRHHRADAFDPWVSERWLVRSLARHPRVAGVLHRRLDRHVGSGALVTSLFAMSFFGAFVFGVVVDFVDSNEGLAEWDQGVALWGSENATATSTDLLSWTTELGGTIGVIVALGVTALFDWSRYKNPHVFSFLALAGIGQFLLANGLKYAIGRTRPPVAHLIGSGGSSFPSGHACAAAATWFAVAFVLGRRGAWRPHMALAGLAALIVAGVAASRALLGVHWLTDVVAGVVVGWGWAALLAIAFSRELRPLGRFASDVATEADT